MSKLVDKNPSIQVRIERGLSQLLKVKATHEKTTIKSLIEDAINNTYMVGTDGKLHRIKS